MSASRDMCSSSARHASSTPAVTAYMRAFMIRTLTQPDSGWDFVPNPQDAETRLNSYGCEGALNLLQASVHLRRFLQAHIAPPGHVSLQPLPISCVRRAT